jgi:hypothetical protein
MVAKMPDKFDSARKFIAERACLLGEIPGKGFLYNPSLTAETFVGTGEMSLDEMLAFIRMTAVGTRP